jgi:hypothetical protein
MILPHVLKLNNIQDYVKNKYLKVVLWRFGYGLSQMSHFEDISCDGDWKRASNIWW